MGLHLPYPNRLFRWVMTTVLILAGSLMLVFLRSYSQGTQASSRGVNEVKEWYTIMLWAHGPRMLRRFVRSYGTVDRDPFEQCSVRNCRVRTDDLEGLNKSDAVFIHLHRTKGVSDLPPYRFPHQRWIFFTDEAPYNTFLESRKSRMKDFNGLFNWSMTYRSDSDISAAYGRTVSLTAEEKETLVSLPNYYKLNDKLAAVLGSNCGGRNHRWPFIYELQKYIDIDTYGRCGRLKCPGHFNKDCLLLSNYKFYLAFENCNCREYMTEKLWWNAYAKESVPVVMGGPKEAYERLCPPNSFIHVEDFKNPKELASFLKDLAQDEAAYNQYFEWKRDYKVLNEHGYFGTPSKHLCRICEALNDKHENKVYDKLEAFWGADRDCAKPNWKPKNKQ